MGRASKRKENRRYRRAILGRGDTALYTALAGTGRHFEYDDDVVICCSSCGRDGLSGEWDVLLSYAGELADHDLGIFDQRGRLLCDHCTYRGAPVVLEEDEYERRFGHLRDPDYRPEYWDADYWDGYYWDDED